MMASLKRSVMVNGKRLLPMSDAKVCGTQKIHVQCSFSVTTDFMVRLATAQ